MKFNSFYSLVAALGLLFSASVKAGVYSDDLSRCLVEASTSADKLTLVRWMFTAMALHPGVKSIASVPDEKNDLASKEVAGLFKTILTKTCKAQAMKAVKYEGAIALQSSFEIFGKVAASELFSHPDVVAGMSKLNKYMENEKIQNELGIAK